MAKRIDELTTEQSARMPEWAQKWIKIGLSTERADRKTFERAVMECYRAAKLEPPKRVIWVSSPIIGALAFPIASYLIELHKRAGQRDAVDGAVDDAVDGAVDGAVDDAVDGAVRDAVGGAVRDAVDDAVDGAVRGAVGGAVGGAVRDAVGGAVRDAVGGAVRDAVDGAVRDAVGGAVRDAVDDAVDGAVRDAVDGAVGDADPTGFRQAIAETIRRSWYYIVGGQFWVGGWYWGSSSYVSFFTDVCGLELSEDMSTRAKAYRDTAESACWWWPHRDFVMVCERPTTIERDARGRLSNVNGAAILWPDGWGVYSVNGVRVPRDIIEEPASLTVARIDKETNAEIRRVMIERFGVERYLRESGAVVLHEDRDIIGNPRQLVRKDRSDDEPMVAVFVTNSTPEPDGSVKKYMLRVHPELRPLLGEGQFGNRQEMTCHNAVASTFGLYGKDYQTEIET